MQVFALVGFDIADPTPTPEQQAAGKTPAELLDLNVIAQCVDTSLQAMPAVMETNKMGCRGAVVMNLILAQPDIPASDAWHNVAPMLLGAILKAAPQLDGLLAVPVHQQNSEDAKISKAIALKNSETKRDLIGFRLDLIRAINGACYATMRQTEEALAPVIQLAREAEKAQFEAEALRNVGVPGPTEPEISGVG